ncbi:MAG: CarD family transcriptional regulator [Oscillospiraceae bacterium]|nr:CarD family transcriptional regulator [Oscillospiraceae bacterium]
MFKIGDTVVYESLGVCRIADIRTEKFPSMPAAQYYVLELIFGAQTTVYAPVDSDKLHIRKVLSRPEVLELINRMPDENTGWIEPEPERVERYKQIIRRGDRGELVGLIKTLYSKREEQLAAGRKFHVCDARIMGDAEKLLYEEFALALGIQPEEVVPFITGKLENRGEWPEK